MRILALVVALVGLVVVAIAAFAPASLVDARLAAATEGQLKLERASGTLWNGRGEITDAAHSWTLPIGWTLDPRRLVRGEVALTLQPVDGGNAPQGTVVWRDGKVALDGITLALPAAALNAAAAGQGLAFGGTLALDAPHLRLGDGGDGAATLRWSDARVSAPAGTIALGVVSYMATPRNGRIEGRVENRGGDVRIDGNLALGPAGVDVDASVAPLPTTPPAVLRALGALGTPDATGAVRIRWRGGTR